MARIWAGGSKENRPRGRGLEIWAAGMDGIDDSGGGIEELIRSAPALEADGGVAESSEAEGTTPGLVGPGLQRRRTRW